MSMAITAKEFATIRKLVHERSALILEPGKEYLVEARLSVLARADGCTISQLIGRLGSPAGRVLADRVVEAMTTNETAFFRDTRPFDTLRTKVLPEVIARNADRRTLSIWCAAASSGQEPYTIAMVLREHFPQLASWNVRILGTDISAEMVERTRAGRYSQLEVGRGLPDALLTKYFTRVGTDWQVSPELRRLVEVRKLNLAAPWGALAAMDIVFCRNVLIYFDMETKRSILQRITKVAGPDGFLFLGASETTRGMEGSFELVEAGTGGCYRVLAAGEHTGRRAS
jgi:chemotaxis protein methyltransferase CheR